MSLTFLLALALFGVLMLAPYWVAEAPADEPQPEDDWAWPEWRETNV